MKKLFLCSFFARQELNIVYQQKINIAVTVAKLRSFVVANGIDHLVGK